MDQADGRSEASQNRAWEKTASVDKAQAGFRGAGMFPLNKQFIPASAFSLSETTEGALPPLYVTPTNTEQPEELLPKC